MAFDNYKLTEEEMSFIQSVGSSPANVGEESAAFGNETVIDVSDADALKRMMIWLVGTESYDVFCQFVTEQCENIRNAAREDASVAETLVMCYKLGISYEHGPSMNDLGALYYRGDIVEQDYAKAAELYELAAEWGCHQSIVNLGYIYEYGRIGEPDYQKAYQCYALAAALDASSEALYKISDMYSRGKAVPRNIAKAYALWQRSYQLAEGLEEEAQPAIRIARVLVDLKSTAFGVRQDPLRALFMFQIAETGLRMSVAKGMTYYEKRLQQAIEGQKQARALLDSLAQRPPDSAPHSRHVIASNSMASLLR